MSLSTIRAELESRLKTWADAQVPKIPVSYQNVSFTKPANYAPFVECFLLPVPTLNKEITGKRKTMTGLFQVNVWAPKGKGMGQAETLAQGVVNAFPILPKSAVSIESTPYAESPTLDDSGYVIVPVLIKYRYEAE